MVSCWFIIMIFTIRTLSTITGHFNHVRCQSLVLQRSSSHQACKEKDGAPLRPRAEQLQRAVPELLSLQQMTGWWGPSRNGCNPSVVFAWIDPSVWSFLVLLFGSWNWTRTQRALMGSWVHVLKWTPDDPREHDLKDSSSEQPPSLTISRFIQ